MTRCSCCNRSIQTAGNDTSGDRLCAACWADVLNHGNCYDATINAADLSYDVRADLWIY